jgi:hypothetical protein
MDAGISSNAREKNTEMAEFMRNKFLRVMKISTHEVTFSFPGMFLWIYVTMAQRIHLINLTFEESNCNEQIPKCT